jgi:putative adenylate-forming enzyme
MTYISQLNTIENIRKDLQTLNPNIVSAPPMMLKILAKELELKHYSIHPKRLISYAEVLSPEDRIYIEKVFQCKIFETYKCTEGAIGMPCSLGKLHVSEDLLAVHLYNSDGTPTPPGTPCYKMIVTDLHKISQPFIQYELNDIITISKTPCECGSSFRVIERIQGRGDDIFWGQRTDKNELHFIFPDYISRAIITSSEDIEEYQAIQKSFDNILIRIELKKEVKDTKSTTENITKNIEQVFLAYNCKKPQITVVFEKPQINPNSLKLIRIHREFKVEEK